MKPELLAPAGNIEKLKFAIKFGADAVYMGYPGLSLRAAAENFDVSALEEAREITLNSGKKLYVACNIFAFNDDLKKSKQAILHLKRLNVDALIVSDPGVVLLVKELWPDGNIHLSTQSNTTNSKSVKFWAKQGVRRVCLAREVCLSDVRQICRNTDAEIEVFVHGSMCISYSGRCYLSKHLAGRDANQGDCAHSCRWSYDLLERKRPGEYMSIMEDGRGTYIMNSKDLCLAKRVPNLIEAGGSAFKIEGRTKTIHYISVVTSVYRQIIDNYLKNRTNFSFDDQWMKLLKSVSHREYTHGFIDGWEAEEKQRTDTFKPLRGMDFVGVIEKKLPSENGKNRYLIKVKNRFAKGNLIEFFTPEGKTTASNLDRFFNVAKNDFVMDVHPNDIIEIETNLELPTMTLLRKASSSKL